MPHRPLEASGLGKILQFTAVDLVQSRRSSENFLRAQRFINLVRQENGQGIAADTA